ncbi:MAG: hypothetical protein M1422_08080 [Candidatus Thermoplasmatota archaeon]|jgi:uncharacterized coiled-coil DUF342 family protein|nr:hypothetical protein [Candidatus Sysuiplasma jiujiangense]MBX8639053.1 hypothetical protein [Candidatus Sysuiplasma jiujiangense]MBX8641835.1 hypothetical protein [Candidatus Sysuiplasma jiujiangense]MCL4318213.1 hypothetical protein [Candidatus Thermoplasmatota archaeon]MCL5254376.1 hypothetical protein [Candidatus Thermoplasmatota archaeon]
MPRRTISELDRAEEKYSALIEKRNMLNDDAAEIRKARDMLNDQKEKLFDEVLEIKKQKDEKAAEMRSHKLLRNELNARAKELIQLKRELYKNAPDNDIYREIDRLNREFDRLERKQQTETLTIPEENEVIQKMRTNLAERNRLLSVSHKGEQIAGKLSELNAQIDSIFEQARKEHEFVISLYAEVQASGEQMSSKLAEASILVSESNKRHKEYLEKRGEADKCHAEAMEMRGLILERRRERREKVNESRQALREQNLSVRKTLFDERASEEEAEKQLQELLKRGKVSLR